MSVPPQIQNFLNDVDKRLHEPSPITNVLQTVEQKTGVKRLHIVLGVLGLQAFYLVFGHFAELVCNTIGFIYPAYCSIKAIESNRKDDDTQWLTYWVVFAVLSVLEFFSHQILSVFPVYWLFKAAFLIWLYFPSTLGAYKIYHKFLRPFVLKHQSGLEEKVGKAADAVKNAIRDNVNQHLD
ncbi:unnamed protein product [Auanema sp. JU1783]|nr:unnamed protein product [Auanema sp. JU1783]